MEECSYISSIGAYHDGELRGDRLAEVERHLAGCARCAGELEELRALTRAIAADAVPGMSAQVMSELHDHVEELTSERSDYRFAQLLSGIAAAVLIGVGGWLLSMPDSPAVSTPGWEHAAVTLQPEMPTENGTMRTAQWIATELAIQR